MIRIGLPAPEASVGACRGHTGSRCRILAGRMRLGGCHFAPSVGGECEGEGGECWGEHYAGSLGHLCPVASFPVSQESR